jgi:hypothetical protein
MKWVADFIQMISRPHVKELFNPFQDQNGNQAHFSDMFTAPSPERASALKRLRGVVCLTMEERKNEQECKISDWGIECQQTKTYSSSCPICTIS